MKTTKNNIKKAKVSMRNIAKLLDNYAQAEDFQFETRNSHDYDMAKKTMQVIYDDMMRNLNEVLHVMNLLGCSCDRLSIKEYMVLLRAEL